MTDDFQDVIEKLRLALGFQKPVASSTTHIMLTIDGVDLKLSAAEDGRHILVSGSAGRLAQDPARCSAQATKLLQLNLDRLTTHAACTCIDPHDEEAPAIVVRGICPCSCKEMDRLAQTIAEVSSLTEMHRRELEERSGSSPTRRLAPITSSGETLIVFRP